MGESHKKHDITGKYSAHYSKYGWKTGESREVDGIFGKRTEHYDASGRKIGESRQRKTFFGDSYTEHRDREKRKIGESHQRKTFFGDSYTEHRDRANRKVGESRRRETLFGPYTQHKGGFFHHKKPRRPQGKAGGSGRIANIVACVGFAVGFGIGEAATHNIPGAVLVGLMVGGICGNWVDKKLRG